MEELDFELTTVVMTQVGDKLDDVQSLEFLLNANLSLRQYGRGVEQVFAMFTVLSPEAEAQPPVLNYHDEEKLLEIILPLGYRDIVGGARQEALARLMENLLQAMDELALDPPAPGFAFDRLARDMRAVLNANAGRAKS